MSVFATTIQWYRKCIALSQHILIGSGRVFIYYKIQMIFDKRVNLRPYEYPNLLEYVDAMRHSYWIHTEYNYS